MQSSKSFTPVRGIKGTVEVPGSKSCTNRALIISALAHGESELENVLLSDDTGLMIDALRKFGVEIKQHKNSLLVKSPKKLCYNGRIYAGNAGTTMRFLTGLCSLGPGEIGLYGNKRMHQRPIGDLVDALDNLIDGTIETKSINIYGKKCPPVIIKSKGLRGGKTSLRGDTSSQYLSSILMISPFAKKEVEIEIAGDLTSKPYADITIDIMKQFGVAVENNDHRRFFVPAGQRYNGIRYKVECDASNISYFLGVAAITNSRIRVNGINTNSVQGDIHFADLLEEMGCKVIRGHDYIEVSGPEKLNSIEIDMNSMPDTAQTLAVIASVANGITKIYGIWNLREKETDRIKALETELCRVGIKTESARNSLTVYGGKPSGAEIETYDDHRMAMSFSMLGLRVPGIKVLNPGCVAKSFPDFYERLESLLGKDKS